MASLYQEQYSMPLGTGDIRNRKPRYKSYDTHLYGLDENLKEKKSYRSLIGLSTTDTYNLIGLTIIAFFVRLYQIDYPTSVVFDEVHFGGFAAKYIKGKFFMDVHPPLAKLLITFAGVLGGFDGNFTFNGIGMDYIEPKVPYVIMRLVSGILGVIVIPIAYLTIKLAGFSTIAAFLVSSLVIFENGLITQSRLILLDSPLVAFTAFTVLMWVKFLNQEKRPFELWWWVWLAMTGVGLGLTVSVKWVGLFTIAFIGLSTISGLWRLLGDLRVTPALFLKHFIARALCLIIIPIALYLSFFVLHFAILPNSGTGDGFMSSEFQQTLRGHGMQDMPLDIAFGSSVSIKHVNTQGGYLHSHLHNYPTGSKQQQITLYPHKDDNNLWIIQNETDPEIPFSETDPIWIHHNDVIRLNHAITKRRMHSHDVRAPVTDADYQNEVSAYGYDGFPGDANDFWRVEITDYDKSDPESRERLRTLHTKFRLYHVITGCYLYSHKVKLPDWGFEQQEVTCVKNGHYPNTIWYIESNSHPKLPDDAEKVNYRKPGFLKKFLELNKVMWTTNSGLTDSHPYDSRPLSWILLTRGINFWSKEHRQIYLLGNPLVWWSSAFAILIFIIAKLIIILREKRGYKDHLDGKKDHFESWSGLIFMGWCLHYLPFFIMSRQLFLHHYFPSLYFAILLIGIIFDLFTHKLSSRYKLIIAIIFLVASVYVFTIFSPIIYGGSWTKSDCQKAKWISTWDFECQTYHDKYEDYLASRNIIVKESDIIVNGSNIVANESNIVVNELNISGNGSNIDVNESNATENSQESTTDHVFKEEPFVEKVGDHDEEDEAEEEEAEAEDNGNQDIHDH
ncbi:PMT-domain-containing protein [Gigaspora margarita]|uniref:Dolichyl-phosphate-mannose--protein mannosyltransferase n=1 Tax=Gigaspora margarita TaxID=4874 RepID=A0A8H3X1L7_GIGMA|nr:PMT-domain-containing protein [Gigaspora margarita]